MTGPPTSTATPVDGLTRGAFRGLATLRRARAFHPVGVALHGIATVASGGPVAVPTGQWPAVVRFSRGAGLPEPLPDLLGVAVRLEGAAGLGDPLDLLMTSTGSGRVGRHLLRPTRSFSSGRATTLLPCTAREGSLLFSARVLDPEVRHLGDVASVGVGCGPLEVELAWAVGGGPWQRFASVELRERLAAAAERALDLDPFHTGPDLVPAGLLNRLRRPAYGGSRAGRPGP